MVISITVGSPMPFPWASVTTDANRIYHQRGRYSNYVDSSIRDAVYTKAAGKIILLTQWNNDMNTSRRDKWALVGGFYSGYFMVRIQLRNSPPTKMF